MFFHLIKDSYPLILESTKKLQICNNKKFKFSCLGRSSVIEIESSTSKLAAAVLSGLEFNNN